MDEHMGTNEEPNWTSFLSEGDRTEQVAALRKAIESSREEDFTEARQESGSGVKNEEQLRQWLALAAYEDEISIETISSLVGFEQAKCIHLLKRDLIAEPLDVPAPDRDADVYDTTRMRTAKK